MTGGKDKKRRKLSCTADKDGGIDHARHILIRRQLMSKLRTVDMLVFDLIVCSSSMDIREKKRRQLEKDFTETGAVLNICLTDNKTSVAKIQRDLIECKSLLYCNREELRRLWLELVEQRRCLELVDQLDRLRSTPDALGYLVTARAWSEATSLMINSNYMLESEIASIPAVQTLKTDLAHKNKFLIDELRKELNRLLYDKPFILALDMHIRNPSRDKSVRSHSE
ncbi:unnamed protein product [Schistosoma margrebowiei]|uniref:Exocyst complex component Sec8 n=1 Tax=Schistosoma margrebowiei TaxID=48269 RepID=A0A183LLT9_9TREM|nr:unnamed protein product [Schistosoma margrebowiei]